MVGLVFIHRTLINSAKHPTWQGEGPANYHQALAEESACSYIQPTTRMGGSALRLSRLHSRGGACGVKGADFSLGTGQLQRCCQALGLSRDSESQGQPLHQQAKGQTAPRHHEPASATTCVICSCQFYPDSTGCSPFPLSTTARKGQRTFSAWYLQWLAKRWPREG